MTFYEWFMSRPGRPKSSDDWSVIQAWSYIRERFVRPKSKMGGGNQVRIEVKRNYNGSGPNAFGGAKEWMAISVDVSCPLDMPLEVAQTLLHDFRMAIQKAGYYESKS
jgi:hypothetical protein